ncbi:hypothetical protein NVS55_34605 [Myxococcus stipitatus]|uniref:hypothetical protein n=1 Tax=Myxococcus stipitatus TaxID=83455 RepID=UPI003144F6A9
MSRESVRSPTVCPGCATAQETLYIATAMRTGVRFSASFRCTQCGHAFESDNTGIPEDVQPLFIAQHGRWALQLIDTGPLKVKVLQRVRELLNLGVQEVGDLLKTLPRTLATGTRTEMESLLIGTLTDSGARAVISPVKDKHHTPPPTPRGPWRRLKAELGRADASHLPVKDFASLGPAAFDFLMNLVEQRDGSPRQIKNALWMASTMRGWGVARVLVALPSLCTHEDFEVRNAALRILLVRLLQAPDAPGELAGEYTLHSFDDAIRAALSLGVEENTARLAHEHLARP